MERRKYNEKITNNYFYIIFTIKLCLQQTLYWWRKDTNKNKVIALTLTAGGKRIEWVFKENLGQCLKSKRLADREVNGERVVFACEIVKALLQKDKQSKYGIRLLKIIE